MKFNVDFLENAIVLKIKYIKVFNFNSFIFLNKVFSVARTHNEM